MKSIVFGTAILALTLFNRAGADPRYTDNYPNDSHVEIRGDVHTGSAYHEEGLYIPKAYRAPVNLRIFAYSRDDQYIADRIVRTAIAGGVFGRGNHPVTLSVRSGRVHWTGTLYNTEQRRNLIAVTRSVRGVRDINNELRVD